MKSRFTNSALSIALCLTSAFVGCGEKHKNSVQPYQDITPDTKIVHEMQYPRSVQDVVLNLYEQQIILDVASAVSFRPELIRSPKSNLDFPSARTVYLQQKAAENAAQLNSAINNWSRVVKDGYNQGKIMEQSINKGRQMAGN